MTTDALEDYKKFVRTWQTAGSAAEVSDKTGLSRVAVSSKAAWLRKKGVKLKYMNSSPRGRKLTDDGIEELNKLVKELD